METFKTNTHQFVISVDNKNINDMKHVMNEYINMGYKKSMRLATKEIRY